MGVTVVDIDPSDANYRQVLEEFAGFDHYFILTKDLDVVMHSKSPYILRENVKI